MTRGSLISNLHLDDELDWSMSRKCRRLSLAVVRRCHELCLLRQALCSYVEIIPLSPWFLGIILTGTGFPFVSMICKSHTLTVIRVLYFHCRNLIVTVESCLLSSDRSRSLAYFPSSENLFICILGQFLMCSGIVESAGIPVTKYPPNL